MPKIKQAIEDQKRRTFHNPEIGSRWRGVVWDRLTLDMPFSIPGQMWNQIRTAPPHPMKEIVAYRPRDAMNTRTPRFLFTAWRHISFYTWRIKASIRERISSQ